MRGITKIGLMYLLLWICVFLPANGTSEKDSEQESEESQHSQDSNTKEDSNSNESDSSEEQDDEESQDESEQESDESQHSEESESTEKASNSNGPDNSEEQDEEESQDESEQESEESQHSQDSNTKEDSNSNGSDSSEEQDEEESQDESEQESEESQHSQDSNTKEDSNSNGSDSSEEQDDEESQDESEQESEESQHSQESSGEEALEETHSEQSDYIKSQNPEIRISSSKTEIMLTSTTISFETAVNKTELSQAENFLATNAASTSVEHSETEDFLATTSFSTLVEPVETGNFLSTISTSTSASTLIEQIPSLVRSFTAKPPSSNTKGTNVEEEIALSYASGFQSEDGIVSSEITATDSSFESTGSEIIKSSVEDNLAEIFASSTTHLSTVFTPTPSHNAAQVSNNATQVLGETTATTSHPDNTYGTLATKISPEILAQSSNIPIISTILVLPSETSIAPRKETNYDIPATTPIGNAPNSLATTNVTAEPKELRTQSPVVLDVSIAETLSETITTFTMEGVQEVTSASSSTTPSAAATTTDATESDSTGHLNFLTPTPAPGTDDFPMTTTVFTTVVTTKSTFCSTCSSDIPDTSIVAVPVNGEWLVMSDWTPCNCLSQSRNRTLQCLKTQHGGICEGSPEGTEEKVVIEQGNCTCSGLLVVPDNLRNKMDSITKGNKTKDEVEQVVAEILDVLDPVTEDERTSLEDILLTLDVLSGVLVPENELSEPIQVHSEHMAVKVQKINSTSGNIPPFASHLGSVAPLPIPGIDKTVAVMYFGVDLKGPPPAFLPVLSGKVVTDENELIAVPATITLFNKHRENKTLLCGNTTFLDQISMDFEIRSPESVWIIDITTKNVSIIKLFRLKYGSPPTEALNDVTYYITDPDQSDDSGLVAYSVHVKNDSMRIVFDKDQFTRGKKIYIRINLTDDRSPDDNTTICADVFGSVGMMYVDSQWISASGQPIQGNRRKRSTDFDIKILPDTTQDEIKFKTSSIGTFSSSLFIPPNTIDFKDVFNNIGAKLTDSPIVLVVVIVLYVVFIFTGILAHRADRKDVKILTPLPKFDDTHHLAQEYHISVYTSWKTQRRFTGTVSPQLYGSKGESHPIILDDGERLNFSSGTVSVFHVGLLEKVGDIYRIKIWHNSEGNQPSWHLDKVVIKGRGFRRYIFLCSDWLSCCHGDGSTIRVLPEVDLDPKINQYITQKQRDVFQRHLLVSIIRKKSTSRYTRLQRVAVLCVMFFLMMVSSAMWYGTENRSTVTFKFKVGSLSIGWNEFYVGCVTVLTVYPVVWILSEFFRHSKMRKCAIDKTEAKLNILDEGIVKELPRCFLWLAWALVFATISAASFFTVLYSLDWGGDKSNEWLGAFFLSFVQAIFVLDPFVLLIVFFIIRKIQVKVSVPEEDHHTNERKQLINYGDAKALENIKKQRFYNEKVLTTVSNIITSVVYVFLLISLATTMNGQLNYHQKRQTDKLLESQRAVPNKVKRGEDIYSWIKENLFPSLFAHDAYNGKKVTLEEQVYTAYGVDYRIMPLQIRQLRMREKICSKYANFEVNKVTSKWTMNGRCVKQYDDSEEETRDFYPNWTLHENVDSVLINQTNHKDLEPFGFQKNTGHLGTMGFLSVFPGRGYVATLGSYKNKAIRKLDKLKEQGWIDRLNKGLIMDVLTYNANTNLFTRIRIVVEQSSMGYMFIGNETRSFTLYNYVGDTGTITLAMQVVWILILIVMIGRMVKGICALGKKYVVSSYWNILRLCVVTSSIAAAITFVVKVIVTSMVMKSVKNELGSIISFDTLLLWVDISSCFMGLTVFLATIQLMEVLCLNEHISVLNSTLRIASTGSLSYGLILGMCGIAFVHTGFLLFSRTVYSFRNMLTSMTTGFVLTMGLLDYPDVFDPERDTWLSRVYHSLYSMLVLIIVINLFITLINQTYDHVRTNSLFEYDPELMEFIWNKIKTTLSSFIESIGMGNRAGDQQSGKKLRQRKKNDKHRLDYDDTLTCSEDQILQYLDRFEKKFNQLTEEMIELDLEISELTRYVLYNGKP